MIWVLANSCLLMVGVRLVDLSVWRFNLENLRFNGFLSLGGVLERFTCFVALWLCFGACPLFVLKLGFRCGCECWSKELRGVEGLLNNIRDVGEE